MFTEQEVFAKIGFLTMALDKVQAQLAQAHQALAEAQAEEKDEPTGDEDGRTGEVGGENS